VHCKLNAAACITPVVAALLPKVVTQRYEHPFGPWRRRYMVGLVALIAAMLCADQNLLAPNVRKQVHANLTVSLTSARVLGDYTVRFLMLA
jgi:hypothetical protein